MTDKQNRLFLRYRDAEAVNAGQLEDYAVYALALLALYGTTFEAEFPDAGAIPRPSDDSII